nr:Trehalase [Paraburkholderia busanensis]
MSRPIEDYGLIGDGESAALVNRDASIDWLCWPRFDGDACFAALLGNDGHGHWSIAPVQASGARSRRYQNDTLVLETDFEDGERAVRIVDFMPMREAFPSIVRIVTGLRGTTRMRSTLRLRFDYGAVPPWLSAEDDAVVARVGPDLVAARAPVAQTIRDGTIEAEFDVKPGDRLAFVMSYGRSHLPVPPNVDAEAALATTAQFWRGWISRFDDSKTDWPAQVRRSLITLKALFHRPTGGLIAAATTSLPEAPGGEMNWDYRYCWLRDASFTLGAMLNAGFHEEALAWRDWLLRAIAGSPEHIHIVYRVDGARHLEERTIDALPGYRYSTPVRIGNAASGQHQVDVLGELIDCLNLARRGGILPSEHEAEVELRIIGHLEKTWHTEGSGIWESRGKSRHYTYSKVMAWAAFDRFVSRHRQSGAVDIATVTRLTALRDRVREEVMREGWNGGLNSFVQYYGGQTIDASLLLLPLIGFISATDPRMASTIERIERELWEDGLIRRTSPSTQSTPEGAFLPCSCWLASCLNLQGRITEARTLLERVLGVSNDLGLLSEEYNVVGRHLAGNFPQALTHLALVNTALGLCGSTIERGRE